MMDAETRIGELLREIPRNSLRSEDQRTNAGSEKTLPDGISWNQSSAYQRMAEHQDIVEQIKAAARENGILATRQAVLEKTLHTHHYEALSTL